MMLQDAVFLVITSITLLGAVLAVSLKNVFHNALSLILSLFGVACLFIYLNSEFLAIMEVIIYIGAISVAIIFAIMLSQPGMASREKRRPSKVFKALAIGALLFGGLIKTLTSAPWPQAGVAGDYSLAAMGKNILTVNALPFEAVSVVLLVAIIGALLLSSKETR